jgi:hypothetical protein
VDGGTVYDPQGQATFYIAHRVVYANDGRPAFNIMGNWLTEWESGRDVLYFGMNEA